MWRTVPLCSEIMRTQRTVPSYLCDSFVLPSYIDTLRKASISVIMVSESYEGELPVQFEWDEDKAALKLKKHGIDFRDAVRVFYDVDRIEWYDIAHSVDEDRYNTIGKVRDVIFVVYTERRERTRIISARKATPNERRMYDDRNL